MLDWLIVGGGVHGTSHSNVVTHDLYWITTAPPSLPIAYCLQLDSNSVDREVHGSIRPLRNLVCAALRAVFPLWVRTCVGILESS